MHKNTEKVEQGRHILSTFKSAEWRFFNNLKYKSAERCMQSCKIILMKFNLIKAKNRNE